MSTDNTSGGETKPVSVVETNRRLENAKKKNQLSDIYDALKEKGYDPIKQMVGYVLTGDPTYITTYKNARDTMRMFDRFELIELILKEFYSNKEEQE